MAQLTQAEIDALTCMLCDDPADVVVPRDDSDLVLSLCAACLREMHEFVSAPKVH